MGVLFMVIGLLATYFLVVQPLINAQAAQQWQMVPAVVTNSEVKSSTDSDGDTTHRFHLEYEYEIDGRKYQGDRYSFLSGSSSGRSGKQALVDDHPPGKQIDVYVDPNDPTNVVVQRDLTNDIWFGLIPLVFFIVGLAMFIGSFFINARRSARKQGRQWMPTANVDKDDDPTDQQQTLRPTGTPLGKFIGLCVFALIWNGIVSVFVVIAIKSHLEGNPEWFLTLFMIPFVLIGLGVIMAALWQFLAIFNPKPVLEVNTASPALGQTLIIDWRFEGRVERIETVTISLLATERATYQRGTDTVTDTHEFYNMALAETSNLNDIMTGSHVEAVLPADTMHSFEARHNKIEWQLQVRGKIRRWPDVKHDFKLVVQPQRMEDMSYA